MSSGKFKDARFCPVCGNATLERDDYRKENGNKIDGLEFICPACCIGFELRPSLRHRNAHHWIRQEARGYYRSRDTEGKLIEDGRGNLYSSWCNACQLHSRQQDLTTGEVICVNCKIVGGIIAVTKLDKEKTLWQKIRLFFIRKKVYN